MHEYIIIFWETLRFEVTKVMAQDRSMAKSLAGRYYDLDKDRLEDLITIYDMDELVELPGSWR